MVTRRERKQHIRHGIWPTLFQTYKAGKLLNIVLISIMSVIAAGLLWSTYLTLSKPDIPVSGPGYYRRNLVFWPQGRDILFYGIPGLAKAAETQSAVKIMPELDGEHFSQKFVLFFAGIDFNDLRSLFLQEIPFTMAFKKSGTPIVSAATLPNFPKFDLNSTSDRGKPLVGIYHTHTAESFIPNSGAAHKPGGQRGDIVEVGAALARQLEKNGIRAIHSNNIHDYPSFMKAYGPSEITAQKMLTDYPSIQMLFDIHRDADKRQNVTTTINGIQAAKITIIVATGQPDLPQPLWQQNHAFAKLVDAKLNSKFPGLSRGIQLVEWRFNQHLHPRALLIEVGSQESSKEEAIYSIEMLGDVLAEIIAESKDQ